MFQFSGRRALEWECLEGPEQKSAVFRSLQLFEISLYDPLDNRFIILVMVIFWVIFIVKRSNLLLNTYSDFRIMCFYTENLWMDITVKDEHSKLARAATLIVQLFLLLFS